MHGGDRATVIRVGRSISSVDRRAPARETTRDLAPQLRGRR